MKLMLLFERLSDSIADLLSIRNCCRLSVAVSVFGAWSLLSVCSGSLYAAEETPASAHPVRFQQIQSTARNLNDAAKGASDDKLRELDRQAALLIAELIRLGYPGASASLRGKPILKPDNNIHIKSGLFGRAVRHLAAKAQLSPGTQKFGKLPKSFPVQGRLPAISQLKTHPMMTKPRIPTKRLEKASEIPVLSLSTTRFLPIPVKLQGNFKEGDPVSMNLSVPKGVGTELLVSCDPRQKCHLRKPKIRMLKAGEKRIISDVMYPDAGNYHLILKMGASRWTLNMVVKTQADLRPIHLRPIHHAITKSIKVNGTPPHLNIH